MSAAAVPIYVRHFLNGQASGGSWRRSLANAMHARIRAVQQQNLPHAVLLPSNLPPLFPQLSTPCRLSSTLVPTRPPLSISLQPHNGASVGRDQGVKSLVNGHQTAPLAATGFPQLNEYADVPSAPLPVRSQQGASTSQPVPRGSYAAALQSTSRVPAALQNGVSNGRQKAKKRTVTDLNGLKDQPEGPVKRPLNGMHPSLLDLEQQTAQLQKLIEDSKASESSTS